EDHDDLGLACRGGGLDHPQPGLLRLRPRRAVGAQPDAHVHTAAAQVEGMGVPLAAVADDRDLLALQRIQGGVLVVIDVHAARSLSLASRVRRRVPRNMATFPVRTISLMPIGLSKAISALILSSDPVTSTT